MKTFLQPFPAALALAVSMTAVRAANVAISALPETNAPSATAVLPIVDAGVTWKVQHGLFLANLTNWAKLSTNAAGGTTVWTNNAGVIEPADGQLTNTLRFTSGLADNATNVAMVVDTASTWSRSSSGPFIATFRHQGTNVVEVYPDGGLVLGPYTHNWSGNEGGIFFIKDPGQGDGSSVSINIGTYDNASGDDWTSEWIAQVNNFTLNFHSPSGYLMNLRPAAVDAADLIVYRFNTLNDIALGNLAAFQNNGTNKFTVASDGAVAAGTTNQWKTGAAAAGAGLTLVTTNYIEITVNGVPYKLALVQ